MTWLGVVLIIVLVGGALATPSQRRARWHGYAKAGTSTQRQAARDQDDSGGDGGSPG